MEYTNPSSSTCLTQKENYGSHGTIWGIVDGELLPLLAKMNQEDRNLILFMAGRVSKKQGGIKAGRKFASSAAA
jgi:hypothetical protein